MLQIGKHQITTPFLLAPMAGITDAPFRSLCRQFGAGLTYAEMVTADQSLWHTDKSRLRLASLSDPSPRAVQLIGNDPVQMAEAARAQADRGADIIDINMGCPAKKVCKKAAGSALLQDEKLVAAILQAVVNAVSLPVTLKIRTGWSAKHKNAATIARIAEQTGIAALTIHGRTREDLFRGEAEHDTLAQVARQVSLPLIANGDISEPEKAVALLKKSGAVAIMIGRGAFGRPWIFQQMLYYLQTGKHLPDPDLRQIADILLTHLRGMYTLYGEQQGVRIARKHCTWYLQQLQLTQRLPLLNQQHTAAKQETVLQDIFAEAAASNDHQTSKKHCD